MSKSRCLKQKSDCSQPTCICRIAYQFSRKTFSSFYRPPPAKFLDSMAGENKTHVFDKRVEICLYGMCFSDTSDPSTPDQSRLKPNGPGFSQKFLRYAKNFRAEITFRSLLVCRPGKSICYPYQNLIFREEKEIIF